MVLLAFTRASFFAGKVGDVIAYDNMTKFELDRTGYRADAARDYNWNWLGELGVERVIGDIRDLEQILDCSSGCDFIVHTAAQPAVTISIEEPLVDLKTNVFGNGACPRGGQKAFDPGCELRHDSCLWKLD